MLAFSAQTRLADLQRMAEDEVDLLVVGGGITGCGVALDAASRGLSVALVEKEDFAAGTSGRSSRMIHGGVRYLEHRDFDVIHECLRERAILLRLAPHLVRPIPMYLPTRSLRQRALFRLGLLAYDVLAIGRNIGSNRLAGEEEIRRAAPGLGTPTSGVVYFECRTDDVRLTVEVAREAKRTGALMANHAAVEALMEGGGGRVRGARVVDGITGERFEVRARLTVNAAGIWAEQVQGMAMAGPRLLHPSKGVHLVFRPGAIRTRVGVSVPSLTHDRRFVFVVPWGDRVYAGTTDTAYQGDLDDPKVTEEDRDYVVGALARAFPGVTKADVVAEWAGLRPLLAGGPSPSDPSSSFGPSAPPAPRTADLSRRHAIYESPPGLLSITGGKLTAYRSMAEELVDRAVRSLGIATGPSRTREIPLGLTADLAAERERAVAAGSSMGLRAEASARLLYRYGDGWPEAVRLIREDPSLAEPVVDGLPVLGVEAVLARSREMAITDDDVFVRRTRLTTMDARKAGVRGAAPLD